MNTDERIARLEALLARVRSRSRTDARSTRSESAQQTNGTKPHDDDEVLSPAALSPLSAPTPVAAFRPSPLPPSPAESSEHKSLPPSVSKITRRPEAPPLFATKRDAPPMRVPIDGAPNQTLADATPPRHVPPHAEPSGVRAVDPPPMEVIELDVDPDPSMPPPSVAPPSSAVQAENLFESRSRLVSAPPVAIDSDVLTSLDSDEPFHERRAPSDPTIEAARVEVTRAELDAIEEADRAPTSSRRPISMEAKMSELEDPVPLHAPPPESGKLPAASPAIELVALEPSPTRALAREALRAGPLAPTEVAVFVGRTPSDSVAKTFGDLLDATLSL